MLAGPHRDIEVSQYVGAENIYIYTTKTVHSKKFGTPCFFAHISLVTELLALCLVLEKNLFISLFQKLSMSRDEQHS